MSHNDLFYQMVSEFMTNTLDKIHADRQQIIYNISFSQLDSDKYYALLVNDIRYDTTRSLFRSLRDLMDDYLN